MAKRKLTAWMRDKLLEHTGGVVIPTKEAATLEAAYKKAEPLVRDMVEKRFPPKDMEVCNKYSAARNDDCITIQFPDNSFHQFSFTKGTGPLVVSRSCSSQCYIANVTTAKAVDAWIDATKVYKEERNKRLTAYKALLQGSTYLDDVILVWPEARNIIPLNALPIALGPEQIAIIKSDQKERSKVAA